MQHEPYDSSGTDDDLIAQQNNRGPRGNVAVNGRAPARSVPYLRLHDMEIEIHQLEQEAYTSVLRAFKAQSDAISWEKESLITELRKELRVSDEEHRELLNKVNADDVIRRLREWRQSGGGSQPSLLCNPQVVQNPTVSAPHKRQKTSHSISSLSGGAQPSLHSPSVVVSKQPFSATEQWGAPAGTKGKKAKTHVQTMPIAQATGGPTSLIGRKLMTRWPDDNSFYEAVIKDYNPITGNHILIYDMGTPNESYEQINLYEMAPEDIKWDGDDPGISNRQGFGTKKPLGNNGAVLATASGRGRFSGSESKKGRVPSQNGIGKISLDEINVPSTDDIVKQVEKVLSNPDIYEIEKAKKLLKDQEQSLLNAIARLEEASDAESEDMDDEVQEVSHGDQIGRNGITHNYR